MKFLNFVRATPQAAIMAQIDLKYARIYIEDGYAGPGGTPLVNHMSGYMSGATTMIVDGFVGAVAVFDRFTVAGDDVIHVISAHTETTGNTTSITFSPALGASVADDAAITMLPHQIEVTLGEGNLSYTEKRAMEYKLDRGLLSNVRRADEEPVEVQMDFQWEEVTAVTNDPPTPVEALKKIGAAAAWVSAGADPCEDYAVNLKIVYTPPCDDEDEIETTLLSEFRYEQLDFSAKDGTISVSGKCNITQATVTRGAA